MKITKDEFFSMLGNREIDNFTYNGIKYYAENKSKDKLDKILEDFFNQFYLNVSNHAYPKNEINDFKLSNIIENMINDFRYLKTSNPVKRKDLEIQVGKGRIYYRKQFKNNGKLFFNVMIGKDYCKIMINHDNKDMPFNYENELDSRYPVFKTIKKLINYATK